MSETKTKERPELSFDGFGINGPDEYRTRLCKFNHMDYSEADCQKYGKLFAAAPELLSVCKKLSAMIGDVSNRTLWPTLGPVADELRAAISKAEGK